MGRGEQPEQLRKGHLLLGLIAESRQAIHLRTKADYLKRNDLLFRLL
jgi:hypothetical protein